jgi:diguanylate cyclase (GGDEF)-like protein
VGSINPVMDARASARTLGPWPALAAGFAVLTALATVAVAIGAVGPLLGWNVSWTAGAVCTVAGLQAAERSALAEHRRRWRYWSLAAIAWLIGQLWWDAYVLTDAAITLRFADAAFWAVAGLVIAGLWRVPGADDARRVVQLAEALPLVAAAIALSTSQLSDSIADSPQPTVVRIGLLIYPVLYSSAAMLTLQAMVGGTFQRIRGAGAQLVLGGLVAMAIAFISWADQLLSDTYVTGRTPVDPLFTVGLLAMAAGGVLAARRPEPATAAHDETGRGGAVLPGLIFFVLLAALIHGGFTRPVMGHQLPLVIGVLLCGATLIGRSTLLERRLRELLGRETSAREELAGREAELARLNARLLEDSRRDPLTGLRNRRALVEELPDVELDARRHGQSFALAICDVDRFKAYNDRLGHIAGDQALRAIAATVRMQLRAGDTAYRYGGEELVLVLRDADTREALAAAERVRAAVESAALPHPADPRGVVTVSIGVATGQGDAPELLARADRALYEAKRGGRNGVRVSGSDTTPKPARRRTDTVDAPLLRHSRGLLEISRAAATDRGPLPVLQSMAELVRTEMGFQTVSVNLREGHDDDMRVVLVVGAEEAREALLGNVNPWATWHPLLDPAHDRMGASWLPAGSYDWSGDLNTYTPESARSLSPDAWDPDDALLLPLRGATGEVLGVVSVDEPLNGRRPSDDEVQLLMAVADHTALAIEQVLVARTTAPTGEAPELRLAAAMLLAETLDLRDAGTAEHSRTVGQFARDTAAALGLAPARVDRLQAAGVLHDLGKLGIADAILHKPGALTDAEWREVTRHPEIGARILEHAGLRDIAAWVLAHHERLDGRGYPSGLAADAIPLEARILAVADAYEAMIADRPYRRGMPVEEARAELERCAGTQFDPTVVEAFLGTLAAPRARPRLGAPAG